MPFIELTCPWCKKKFPSVRNGGKFCSLQCSVDSRIEVRGEDECWPWRGGIFKKDGYGRVSFKIEDKNTGLNAHRVAYELHVGPVPEGLVVRHTCDNPICCNYKNHLIPGTVKDNKMDEISRGRHRRKLTVEQVRIIRDMPFEIISKADVARLIQCTVASICQAHNRKSWRHLEDLPR